MQADANNSTTSFDCEDLEDLKSEGFKVTNNRKSSKYLYPNDETQIDRFDYQHYVLRQFQHGNFNSPMEEALQSGIRVLDVGCGTGIWSLEMARDYPESTFYGIDIQDRAFNFPGAPANVVFVQANILEQLPFDDGYFDWVYSRFMNTTFTPKNWDTAMQEMARVTRPGGGIELLEANFEIKRGPPEYKMLFNSLKIASLARGIDIDLTGEDLSPFLHKAGFIDIVSDYFSLPLGWNSRAGQMYVKVWTSVYEALKGTVMPVMGIKEEEYTKLVCNGFAKCRVFRSYNNLPYAYGTKPLVT